MKKNNRVLAIFGNVANFGQERSNTEVFRLLVNNGYDVFALVNKRGFHWHLQPYFEEFHIPYKKICFPWGIYKKSSLLHILQWIVDVLVNNLQFIYHYLRFRPAYIHFGNEYMFKCLLAPLLFVRANIIFNLGDEPFVKYLHNKFLWRYIITKKVCTFVCVSRFIQNKLEQCGREISTAKKDRVIYNFPPTRIQATKGKQHTEKFVVGFIGQISENKGVAYLTRAAITLCQKYSNVCFVFAGAIENNPFADQVRAWVTQEEESIKQRISFIGFINDIASFYSGLEVCVTPSVHREAMGNVIVEAKLYAKPSVIFRTGGMPELIHHLEDGYICPDKTVEALIEGIEYYIQHPSEARRQGKKAFASIKEMGLDYESYEAEWLSVYTD